MKYINILITILILLGSSYANPDWYDKAIQSDLWQYGVQGNVHLAEHTILVAGQAWLSRKLDLDPDKTELFLLKEMIIWECIQLYQMKSDPTVNYPSVKTWALDSAGDVLYPYVIMRAILRTDPWPWADKFKDKFNLIYDPGGQRIHLDFVF